MASKKIFNPPIKTKNKTALPRNTAVSLTEEQYNEIFNAVLYPSQSLSQKELEVKSPTKGAFPGNLAKSPNECASVENSQHTQNSQPEKIVAVQIDSKQIKNTESSLSTLYSEDITKNATFSTPDTTKKPQRSFREALKNLKKRMNDSLSEAQSMSESFSTETMDFIQNEPLSQPPEHLTKRERLQWLQDRRGTGLYVKCDDPRCAKWRWIENPDPVDLPQKWYCYLNPNKEFSSCSVSEQYISIYVERDLIQNLYTAGSIVWAKIPGYPWWPAMVCDCPETEQYYWMDNELDDEPDWYHVVFLDIDNQVSRKWLRLNDLRSYKHCPNFDKNFSCKGYKKRMEISKQKANEAIQLDIKDRLKRFSFLAIWNKEIFEDTDIESDETDDDIPISQFESYVKKQIFLRKRAFASKTARFNSSFSTITSSILDSVDTPKRAKMDILVSLKESTEKKDKKKTEKEKNAEKQKKIEKQKKVEKQKAEKTNLEKKRENLTKKTIKYNGRHSKDNKVVSSKVDKKLNKRSSNFENRAVTRRMSTGEIKENISKNHKDFRSAKNSQHYEEEDIEKAKEIYNECRKYFMDDNNDPEFILKTCADILEKNNIHFQSTKKKHLRKPSPSSVVTDKVVLKEFEAKRRRTDKNIEPSKMEKIITKAKKTFVPPVKKSLNCSSSTDETMCSDI